MQPNNIGSDDGCAFILVCFYLDSKGYTIEQFPNQLANPKSLYDFGEIEIKNYIHSNNLDDNGIARWYMRRSVINEMKFTKAVIYSENITHEMDDKFKEISTRNSAFHKMNNPEKLKEISNLIEHKLKLKNGKFKKFDSSKTVNLITDEDLRNYRRLTQCYRHSTMKDLEKRKMLKETEPFLIQYGISFLYAIFQ